MPRTSHIVVGVAAGSFWGVFCAWADTQGNSFIEGVANTSGPWILFAFVAGYAAGRMVSGIVVAMAVLSAALLAYRVAQSAGLDDATARSLLTTAAWVVLVIAAAAVFGAAGAVARGGRGVVRRVAWAAPGAMLVAESAVLLSLQGGIDRGAIAYLALEMLAGVAFLFVVIRSSERHVEYA